MRIFSYFHVGYTTSAITASFCKSNDRASQTAKGQSVSGPFKGRHVLNTTGSIIETRDRSTRFSLDQLPTMFHEFLSGISVHGP